RHRVAPRHRPPPHWPAARRRPVDRRHGRGPRPPARPSPEARRRGPTPARARTRAASPRRHRRRLRAPARRPPAPCWPTRVPTARRCPTEVEPATEVAMRIRALSVFEGVVYHCYALDRSHPCRPTLEVDALLREGD